MNETETDYIVLVIWRQELEGVIRKLCETFDTEFIAKDFIMSLLIAKIDIHTIEVLKSYDFPNKIDITF